MRRTHGDDRSAKNSNSNNTAKKQITDGSGGIAMVALTCFGPSLACSKVAPKVAVRFFISAVQFPAYTRRSLASETRAPSRGSGRAGGRKHRHTSFNTVEQQRVDFTISHS